MSVNPGFGGQRFIESTLNKIGAVRSIIDEYSYNCIIEIDGGINEITAPKCVEAGANMLVAGNYIFNSPDYAKAIASLRQ